MESPRHSVGDALSVSSADHNHGGERRRRSSSSSMNYPVTSLGGERSEKSRKLSVNTGPYLQPSMRKTSVGQRQVQPDFTDHTGGPKVKVPSTDVQPTYRLSPHADRCFKPSAVKKIMDDVLEEAMEGLDRYDPVKCRTLSTALSEDIKQRVKWLNYERFKLICLVHVGSINGQGMQIASRCLWNESADSFASTSFKKKDVFAVALMFAVYKE